MKNKAIHFNSNNYPSSFNARMKVEKTNAIETYLQHKMKQHYGNTQKMSLALSLETIGEQYTDAQLEYLLQPNTPSNARNMWLLVAGILLIGILAIYWINKPSNLDKAADSATSPIAQQQVVSSKPATSRFNNQLPEVLPVSSDIEEETGDEGKNNDQPPVVDYIPPKKVKQPVVAVQQTKIKSSPKVSNVADFTPNSYLDPLVNTSIKNDGYRFKLIRPVTKYKFNNGRQTPIIVEGFLEAEQKPTENDFSIHIYSNKERDFENSRSIIVSSLIFREIKGKSNNYTFDYHARIDLKPGLYYYILTKQNDDEPMVTGKVIVGNPTD